MKLDLVAFASHPDDAELGCSGTLIAHAQAGYKVGIVDLTRGELGTRGTPEERRQEAEQASKVIGLQVRRNLGLADGFFTNDRDHQLAVIRVIRELQPEVVLANAFDDRHPDHGKGSKLVSDACFMAGLRKIESANSLGQAQQPWRPKAVYHFIQDRFIQPDFVVDISAQWEQKLQAIKAFRSQFYDPENAAPNTYISSPDFLKFVEARAREYGHAIGTTFGEGFSKERHLGVRDLFTLI
ncbi:bacillithiol biosynthesis deacetylase BshB1 [soil metagenome]